MTSQKTVSKAVDSAPASAATSAGIGQTTQLGRTLKVDGTNGSNVPGRAAIANPATGDPRFIDGTTGPQVDKNKAKTIKLKDGKALDGKSARQQNGGDKKQNNYSVTDANYNPQLGIPKQITTADGKTQEPTYAQTINLYSAAGYVQAFAPAEYDKMVATQNAGGMTVLEAASMATGILPKSADFAAIGISDAAIPKKIPGSGLDAKTYLSSGTDITGQEWARPHHALSQWGAYQQIVNLGIDGETAHVLSGDDGVSGGGRLNGVNNQDGNDSFNAGEIEIWSKAAQIQKETGKPVLMALSHSHAMTDLSPGTLTNPNINKIINAKGGVTGVATKGADARVLEAGSDREKGLLEILTNGAVGDAKKANKQDAKVNNKKLLANKVDPSQAPMPQATGGAHAGMQMGSLGTMPMSGAGGGMSIQNIAKMLDDIMAFLRGGPQPSAAAGMSTMSSAPAVGASTIQAARPAPAPQVARAAAPPVTTSKAS